MVVPAHRSGKLICVWSLQLELLAILARQEVSIWVELEGASNGQGCDNLKRRRPVCQSAPNSTPVPPPQQRPKLSWSPGNFQILHRPLFPLEAGAVGISLGPGPLGPQGTHDPKGNLASTTPTGA